ncbi:MAG: hypothetical protein U0X39_08445 [Bacteroidales bacterium]
MIKPVAFIILLLFTTVLTAAELTDSTSAKLGSSLSVSLNSNGISSIPAFSLGKPAIVASGSFSLGRLSYDPTLAYGLDMRPWYIDSWLHYLLVSKSSFKLRTGFNFSMYFSDLSLTDKVILQGERYWAIELAAIYNFSPNSLLTLMYWNDRGQDPGSLQGHFISLSADRSGIGLTGKMKAGINLQVFYIDYDGNNDGFFVTPKFSIYSPATPLSVFFQATQAISSNIDPFPGFKWNAGIQLTF